jgi:hypothetical protein
MTHVISFQHQIRAHVAGVRTRGTVPRTRRVDGIPSPMQRDSAALAPRAVWEDVDSPTWKVLLRLSTDLVQDSPLEAVVALCVVNGLGSI